MKIGFLTKTIDRKSGGGRFSADIIEGVKSLGHEVVILKVVNDGFEGKAVLHWGLSMFFNIAELRKLLKDCDVIHALDAYPFGVIAWLINRRLHKKLIISALGTYAVAPLYKWQTSIILKQAYKSAKRVIAVSNFTKNEILKKISLNNISIVTPGITPEQHNINKIISDKQFILGVGGIKERKGYHISLTAFAKIASNFPNVDYVIVADPFPPFQNILDKIIKENGLDKRVKFLNDISDKELLDLYNNASLFVLTPINSEGHHIEGYGLVYLEAARAGLPVIGTYGTGAQDAIKNENNGLLVPQNDVFETAKAMTQILSNEEMRKKMSLESFEWAKLNSVENEVKKFLEIYQAN